MQYVEIGFKNRQQTCPERPYDAELGFEFGGLLTTASCDGADLGAQRQCRADVERDDVDVRAKQRVFQPAWPVWDLSPQPAAGTAIKPSFSRA